MKKTLRSIEKGMKYFILEKTFASRKKFITKMTPIDEVKDLIKQLYPVVCKKGLIRFGPEGDGGYLIPDDLEGIEACFSPGVSTASGFEKDCANQNMKVFLADASVSAPAQKHDLFDFIPMFVGSINNDNYFIPRLSNFIINDKLIIKKINYVYQKLKFYIQNIISLS